jgi:putative transposase
MSIKILASSRSTRQNRTIELVKPLHQVITAKLKLNLTAEQKDALRSVTLAYRDALNFASQVAFDMDKTDSGVKLQKATYNHLRSQFKLGAQMACNVPRQVSATYKGRNCSTQKELGSQGG